MGDSATRGGRTTMLGNGVRPTAVNSLTSGGYGAEVSLAWATFDSVTMLTTNWRVSRMLRRVSLASRSAGVTGQKRTAGGLLQTPLKKLNGARLVIPAALMVLTQAMGRGTMAPTRRR